MSSHYDPNQRRIPAGQEGAGRWTDGEAASTSILNSPLLDRDRLIRAALGIREDQKRDGNVQLAFDSQTSTEPLQLPSTRVQPNRPAPLGRGAGGLLGLLFSLLSELNSDDQRTIVIFRRGKFHDESDDGFSGLEFLRTPEEIEKYCGKDFKRVQDIVDHAYDEVKSRGLPLTPQNLGMAVHKRAEDDVEKIRGFTVELTYEKIPPGSDRVEVYGTKGSIRLDVSYRVKIDKKEGKEALCVAEIKTGREVLSYNRMLDIVSRAAVRDREKEEIDQILVTEMRPKNAPAGRRLRERK